MMHLKKHFLHIGLRAVILLIPFFCRWKPIMSGGDEGVQVHLCQYRDGWLSWKFYVSFFQLRLTFNNDLYISIVTTIHVVGHKWWCHQLQIVSGQPWILEGPLCSANVETRRTSNTRNQHWILCSGSRSQASVCKLSAGMILSDHKRIYNVWHEVSCML